MSRSVGGIDHINVGFFYFQKFVKSSYFIQIKIFFGGFPSKNNNVLFDEKNVIGPIILNSIEI